MTLIFAEVPTGIIVDVFGRRLSENIIQLHVRIKQKLMATLNEDIGCCSLNRVEKGIFNAHIEQY